MSRHRDSQVSKTYAAERVFIHSSPRFETWAEVEAFARQVIAGPVVRKYRPSLAKLGIGMKGTAGNNAQYRLRSIHLNRWGWSVGVVLHEIAHLLVDSTDYPAHGRRFRQVYYELAYAHAPAGMYKILRDGFKEHGLTYTAPRPKRTLTTAQKIELTAKLLAGRSKP